MVNIPSSRKSSHTAESAHKGCHKKCTGNFKYFFHTMPLLQRKTVYYSRLTAFTSVFHNFTIQRKSKHKQDYWNQ